MFLFIIYITENLIQIFKIHICVRKLKIASKTLHVILTHPVNRSIPHLIVKIRWFWLQIATCNILPFMIFTIIVVETLWRQICVEHYTGENRTVKLFGGAPYELHCGTYIGVVKSLGFLVIVDSTHEVGVETHYMRDWRFGRGDYWINFIFYVFFMRNKLYSIVRVNEFSNY